MRWAIQSDSEMFCLFSYDGNGFDRVFGPFQQWLRVLQLQHTLECGWNTFEGHSVFGNIVVVSILNKLKYVYPLRQ